MKKSDWALNLLRDDYFIAMMEELRGMEMAKFLNSDYADVEVREEAYMRLRVLESIDNYIQGLADQKLIDEKKLKIL
jgi:ribosomal protein L5